MTKESAESVKNIHADVNIMAAEESPELQG